MDNNATQAERLLESLGNFTFTHPLKGEIRFSSLFASHSGFVCFIPGTGAVLPVELKELKKELDSLGILLIVVTEELLEDKEILVIREPKFFSSDKVEHYLFIEEGWKQGFMVVSPSDFLKTAADFIELDADCIRHLSLKMKTVLAEKEIPLPEEKGGCSCCRKCH
jgi:hypothetical protein